MLEVMLDVQVHDMEVMEVHGDGSAWRSMEGHVHDGSDWRCRCMEGHVHGGA